MSPRPPLTLRPLPSLPDNSRSLNSSPSSQRSTRWFIPSPSPSHSPVASPSFNAAKLEHEIASIRGTQRVHSDDLAKLQNMILEVELEAAGSMIRAIPTTTTRTRSRSNSEPDMYHLEARMDGHDAKLRALGQMMNKLIKMMSGQHAQLAKILNGGTEAEIAALRSEMRIMSRWCDRITTVHETTVHRCQDLEQRLAVAHEEIERLKLEALNAENARDAAVTTFATGMERLHAHTHAGRNGQPCLPSEMADTIRHKSS